ncbi:FliM/FliN family flagellar motor switch protein [Glaciimonas sp. Gout2]|uniref:FliM/FliN family flagellar motor switch protein n=1 Tax=unclassified Glaciimonas TaxID=2644401 RepID=UPI002B235A24|nr:MULTISPECIES: FliM/FliN family flagellar motor switch protein [unclassified Glaciimonas]MEB0010293.1 FliM/FliN family flagellar motor switch protein [Glaciimonas sp. Cout2]MEB0084812.1 FliM/FliN family flagellar motor switch protein [Glaciimonas sp. Gout2]
MRLPSLRRISQANVDAHRAAAQWSQYGLDQEFSLLTRSDMLVSITAYAEHGNWSGYLDLAEWLSNTAPQLAMVARHSYNAPQQVISLFNASDHPLSLKPPELHYSRLHARFSPSPDSECRYVSVMSLQCRVWLDKFPINSSCICGPLSPFIQELPLRLEFLLGSSYVSRHLLIQMARGDLLLVSDIRFALLSGGQALASFSINDLGEIALEVLKQQEKIETLIPSQALDDISVRIDFILQRNVLTLAQLSELYRGQFLLLGPTSEKQIEITANGVTLAKGELVELNGQLGVEIAEISSLAKNVK